MSNEDAPARRRRMRYTPEYKADAVAMVRGTGRTIAEVARGLGIGDQTLGGVGQAGPHRPRSAREPE